MHHMRWDAVHVQGTVPTIKNHTATPISRTELLVFGGYDGRRNHNSLYVFNSDGATWTQLRPPLIKGTPPAGRNGHTATLAEGKLFIIGGWLGSGPLAADDMHFLELASMTWHQPPVVGKSPGPCNMHTADYIAHLRSILVFRGGDGREYLNDLHALNVDTMEWHRVFATGKLPVPRANHSSTLVNGDQIVVFGGWDGQRRLNDIHVLNTRTMVWSAVNVHSGNPFGAALPHPRAGMTFVRHRERVFLFGGSGPSAKCYNDLHIYDTRETRWIDVTPLPDEQQLGGMAAAILEDDDDEDEAYSDATENDGYALSPQERYSLDYGSGGGASGGVRGYSYSTAYNDEFYDEPISYANPNDIHTHMHRDQVVVVGMGPGRRAGHTCSVLEDRKLFIFGGSCGNEYLNDFFVLDTDPAPRAMISSTASPLQTLQQSLRHFVNNDEFSDISFLVEGRVVYAHKIILSLLSERFRGMFSGRFLESQQSQIVIPDIRYVVFVRMLEYLYSGDCVEYEEEEIVDDAGIEEYEDEAAVCKRMSNGNDAARSSLVELQLQDADSYRRDRLPARTLTTTTHTAYSSSFDLDVLLELLVVADQFMLDHLKQYCERVLQHAVHADSVGDILAAANESNAIQLKAICMHYLRNHDIQWVEQGEDEEEDDCSLVDDEDDDEDDDDDDPNGAGEEDESCEGTSEDNGGGDRRHIGPCAL